MRRTTARRACPTPFADRAMRAHLATCSVLRSSAYRKYASSLRPCARVDLHPPPAPRPLPARSSVANVASLVRIQDSNAPPPQGLQASGLQRATALGANCTSEAKYSCHRGSRRRGGVKNPLRAAERSDEAHHFPGGEGAIAGGGFVPARAQGRREEAYFLYAKTLPFRARSRIATNGSGATRLETDPHRAIAHGAGPVRPRFYLD